MSESAKKPFVIFTYVVLVLSTLLVYWQAGNFDFVNYDDRTYVAENPRVLTGLTRDNITWVFTTGYAANWHPLTWLSHMLDCQLVGSRPGWMHLVNVLLHLANVLLLFTVLRKMTGSLWPSAFVAAAFALHPMHVESVAWIAQRKDVLSTFFMLLTVAAYADYVKRLTVIRYIAALVLFAFGLMAKPMLVTLPFVLLLLDYWPLDRFDLQARRDAGAKSSGIVIEKIPFFALAVASSAITFMVQRAGGAVIGTEMLPLHLRAASAFVSYARYIGKMFLPANLSVFYPFSHDSLGFLPVAMGVLLLLIISALVIRFGRRQRYLPVGWFWFLGTLVPVIGFVQVGIQAIADRYTYIPYIGLFIIIAWGVPEALSKWPQRKIALGLSMAVTLAALGFCAHQQLSYWRNSITLFSHAIDVMPDNDLAHYNRGIAYSKLGRWQEALADLREVVRINPAHPEAYSDLGAAYRHVGRGAEAIEAYKQAINIRPDDAEAYNDLGVTYDGLGRRAEAIEAYKQAIRAKPDYARACYNLGVAYVALGRRAEAVSAYEQAIKLKPDFADARYNLANELSARGGLDEAAGQYRAALLLRPDWPPCMNNLAWLIATHPLLKDRDTTEAIRLAAGACRLTGSKEPVYLGTLAAAYASAGRFSEAVGTATKALDLADAANQPRLKALLEQHLSLYKQGKPYIAPAPAPAPDPTQP